MIDFPIRTRSQSKISGERINKYALGLVWYGIAEYFKYIILDYFKLMKSGVSCCFRQGRIYLNKTQVW